MTRPLLTTAEGATELVHALIPAVARLEIRVTELAPGSVSLSMPLAGNANHLGTMYAAALFAIAELPAGILPWTVLPAMPLVPIARTADVAFRRPATTDVALTARLAPARIRDLADAASRGEPTDFRLHLHVVDAAGQDVMTASTLTQLRSGQMPGQAPPG